MTDQSEPLKIAEFEHVEAGPSVTLLRVSGTLAMTPQTSAQRPALIAEHSGGLQRFGALPSPPDPAGVLRAAYSVPAALVALNTSYTLELHDGSRMPLPAPTLGAARRAASASAPVLAPEASDVPAPREGHGEVGALTAALAAAREGAARLEAENEKLTETLAELEVWRGELERRLADTTDQLADTRSRLTAAEMDALSTRAEAAAAAQAARELAEAQAGPGQ